MNDGGKRVSWVELYLDLVFVLAVGQLAHLIVGEPEMRSVWIALGLFFVLWWTWVGFAVLYNRAGADEPAQRLLFLAASVPVGIAAVAVEPASTGDSAVFAGSLAVARLVLAAAHGANHSLADLLRIRITRACLLSAVLFVLSIWAPEPVRYVLWAVAIGIESSAMLAEDRDRMQRARRDHDLAALAPKDPSEALDPHHFAERFGLFLIILLGEVLVEAGQAPVDTVAGWAAVAAATILAAALWWVYFDSAAEINLKVLELSGGSPTMARAIFAVGHMLPAFSLLITAGRCRAAARGGSAADRLLAGLRRHRHLPARHPRVPHLVAPRLRARPRAAAGRDLPARPPRGGAVGACLRLAARRVGGHVRRPDHPRHRQGADRALPRRRP
jgi:low temperature requirement protein LtrA